MKDIKLKEGIRRIYDKSRKRYGSPRIHQQLLREDYHIGKKRVEHLMQELDIQAVAKKKYKTTTDSNHTRPVAFNHLNRNFTPERPNRAWVADITSGLWKASYIWPPSWISSPVRLSAGHYGRD